VAATWNRKGLDGSSDTLRLYVNGKKAASATDADWGKTAAGNADIGGGSDANCSGKFILDNLKIWKQSKTDFADRLQE
jgi:hypothetical protein